MRQLRLIAWAVAMLLPVSAAQGGLLGAMARGAANAGKVERAAAAAASMERAGATAAQAARSGVSAERALGAAVGSEVNLAREARDFGLKRAGDGRFLLDVGRASARLVQSRVGVALAQSPAGVTLRAADGRLMRLTLASPDAVPGAALVWVATGQPAGAGNAMDALVASLDMAAQQAMADVVGTAFREAVFEAQDLATAAKGRAAPVDGAWLRRETREMLRILQDDEILAKARQVSVARTAGSRGASLVDVREVLMFEKKGQATVLWARLAPRQNGPREEVWARVNLDALLARIPLDGL